MVLHHVRVLAGPSLLDEVGSPEGMPENVFSAAAVSHPCSPLVALSYLQSSVSKTFQRCVIDSLEEPEMVSTMLLPGTKQKAREKSHDSQLDVVVIVSRMNNN